jgi:hypothetical protein
VKTIILGGGMVGTLAKYLIPDATVLDWRKPPSKGHGHAPRQYGAMYLHRPLEGLPCREFRVYTTIDGAPATHATAAMYKAKVGKPEDMLVPNWRKQFVEVTVGFEAEALPIPEVQWDMYVTAINLDTKVMTLRDGHTIPYDRLISTIPLYSLMEMLSLVGPTPLRYHAIAVRTGQVPLDLSFDQRQGNDAYVNYISTMETPVYRTTDRNSERHYEWLHDPKAGMNLPSKVLTPGKIYREDWTEAAIFELAKHNIWCAGRMACWRPNELLHDTYASLMNMRAYQGA